MTSTNRIFHRSVQLVQPAASLQSESDVTFYDNRLDPIRYAWERCNPAATFPSALGRTGPGAFAVGLPNPWGSLPLTQKAARTAAARQLFQPHMVGTRPHLKPESSLA